MSKISDKVAYHVAKWPLKEINDLIEQLLIISFDKSYIESNEINNSWAKQYWYSVVLGSK